jgi:hypothetical protein
VNFHLHWQFFANLFFRLRGDDNLQKKKTKVSGCRAIAKQVSWSERQREKERKIYSILFSISRYKV